MLFMLLTFLAIATIIYLYRLNGQLNNLHDSYNMYDSYDNYDIHNISDIIKQKTHMNPSYNYIDIEMAKHMYEEMNRWNDNRLPIIE